jgi:hypothetical protein
VIPTPTRAAAKMAKNTQRATWPVCVVWMKRGVAWGWTAAGASAVSDVNGYPNSNADTYADIHVDADADADADVDLCE